MNGWFTAESRRYIRGLFRALQPHAASLRRRFARDLRKRGWKPAEIGAVWTLAPLACAGAHAPERFVERAIEGGRRLAKLNVAPAAVLDALEEFGQLAGTALEGRYGPAREQLHLAVRLALNQAFYEVREAEAQAFFGLSRAELQAVDADDLMARFVRVLAPSLGAAAGRLLFVEGKIPAALRVPHDIRSGTTGERRIVPGLRGRYQSYWSLPLGSSAVLQLGFSEERRWLPREMLLLRAAGARCAEALQRARMAEEIRRLEAEARHAEEAERRRIGRELHDEAGQSMMLLRLQLEMLGREAPDGLRARLQEARELAGRTAVELRRIVSALSPAVLERLGLQAAVRHLASRFQAVNQAQVHLHFALGRRRASLPAEEVIYRAAQECLHNIARHSGASDVNLSLRSTDKRIRLSVADNGAGFCAERVRGKPRSFGLAGMRERAALLGGRLEVRSKPGQGASIVLELPLRPAAAVSHGKDSRIVG